MANKSPLGLPEGSVRAFLALLIVTIVCFMAAMGKTVPDFLVRGFELALFGYGLVRAAQWQAPSPPPDPPTADPPAAP